MHILIQLLIALSFGKCGETTYEVYYNDINREFYAPPWPLEDHHRSYFKFKSCKLDSLFEKITPKNKAKKSDYSMARIKVVDSINKKELVMNNSFQVIVDSFIYNIDSKEVQSVATELYKNEPYPWVKKSNSALKKNRKAN